MNKLLSLLFILLLPVYVWGQSKKANNPYKEANRLFKQGDKLYFAKKYEEAILYYQKCDSIDKAILEPTSKKYNRAEISIAYCLSNLASDKYYQADYQEAVRYGTEAMKIFKKELGEEHPDYASSLNNLATYYEGLGNYQEAIRLGTVSMEIWKKVLGEEHPDYATSLNNLASYYDALGNYHEAIRLCTEAMEIRKKVLGEEHPDYATSLNNIASYYYKLGNYQEAIRLGTEALEIYEKIFGKEHPDYALSLNNLAGYYDDLGNYQEALRLGTEAMEIFKKVLGEEHPDYATSLRNLASYYYKEGKYDEATWILEQSYKRQESLILKTFAYLTNKERSDYWEMYSHYFNYDLPCYAYYQPNSTLKSLAFNGQLLSKGLLLNAELEIQNLIEQQGNEQMKERYYNIKQGRAKLDELYQLAPAERHMDSDSLLRVIEKEERLLIESSKELGDYTKSLSIKWTDVQQHLQDNDVAVEFVNFHDTAAVEIYIALVLKKDMDSPELVKLFEGYEFDCLSPNEYYNSTNLYNLVWKPLEKYLDGVDNVYFSPSGQFHTIGIEYLPDENGEIFAKKYNAYRLSSTRELAFTRETNPNKKASVYGGIVYNFEESDWQNVSDDAERGGQSLNFLKAAKKESEEITNILTEGSFNVVYGTDKAATEGSFKKLSGSGIKILHIATHGFYEPENKENYSANMLNIGDRATQEDLLLNRSGLYFAGANTALDPEQRKYIPDGVDDGILTAKEISRLDFKGLDLVVLSACETGLGEVTGEGVFGLQRGFKKAGAQAIVMSLWKVNDKPTKDLMTEFYRNLMAGKSKRDAFVSAQDKIRLKYIDPKMWAGFIMVDGIE